MSGTFRVLVTRHVYPEALELLRPVAEIAYHDSRDGLTKDVLTEAVRGQHAVPAEQLLGVHLHAHRDRGASYAGHPRDELDHLPGAHRHFELDPVAGHGDHRAHTWRVESSDE